GQYLADRGLINQAEATLKKAVDKSPDFPPAYYELAHFLVFDNKYKSARSYITKFLEMNPESAKGWFLSAKCAVQEGNIKRAGKDLEKAIQLDKALYEKAKSDPDLKKVTGGNRE
ncbi:MAG: tetratricopeptide repeat protein, partial [Candidatus Eremiobacteraeota bacterium]|nr:tetratricopeptide repeat protein [Candidatus Eremiobacteraeota bacterium]